MMTFDVREELIDLIEVLLGIAKSVSNNESIWNGWEDAFIHDREEELAARTGGRASQVLGR